MTRGFAAHRLGLVGLAVVGAWAAIAIAAPWLAPHDPLAVDVFRKLEPPSAAHLLGTDDLGRDILSRVLFGARVTIPTAAAVVVAGGLLGVALGAVAGYVGGLVEEAAMRLADLFLAVPSVVLALAIAAALGPSLTNSMIAMVAVWWPPYARLARGLVLAGKVQDYVQAHQAIGCSHADILLRKILPNQASPLLALATTDVGNAVTTTAALSFLGLGAVPPSPEWGAMIAAGRRVLDSWWVGAFPGLAILSVGFAFNLLGDAIRDVLDPRLARRLAAARS